MGRGMQNRLGERDIRWVWACGDHYREPSRGTPRMYGISRTLLSVKQAEEVLQEQARVLAGQAGGTLAAGGGIGALRGRL